MSASGKEYERDPSESKQKAMKEADAVLHATHQQLVDMLKSKNLATVNPHTVSVSPNITWEEFVQRRDSKIAELTSSARAVLVWQSKTEDMKTDPVPFSQAVAAFLEVVVSIAKEYIFRPEVEIFAYFDFVITNKTKNHFSFHSNVEICYGHCSKIQLEVLRQVEAISTLTTEITEIYQQKSWDENKSTLLLKTQQFWESFRVVLHQIHSSLNET
jgi:RNA:NAD 2'-phosphotransferase (TPT1/KptA family)